LTLLLCLALAGCAAKGDTSLVRLDQGDSETLAREDVRAAMSEAMTQFQKHCAGETLLRLRYDEGYSLSWVTARDLEPDGNTLVLLVNYLDEDGNQHTGVPWVFTRGDNGSWKAEDLK
jgi:hypothetical protein